MHPTNMALRRRFGPALGRSFLASIAARLGQVLMASLIGHQLGPSGFGVFTFATTAGLLAGELAALGWPLLISRSMPHLVATKQWSELRGLLRYADYFVVSGSVVTSAAMLPVSYFSNRLGLDYSAGLAISALIAPAVALSRLRRQ